MNRVITALLLAPVALYLIFVAQPMVLLVAAALVASLCFWEYCGLAARHGLHCALPVGCAAGVLGFLIPPAEWRLLLVLTTLAVLLIQSRHANLSAVLPSTGALVLGILYVYAPWHYSLPLRERSAHWLFFALATGWIGDIAAYYTGTRLGRHRLAPRISPNKTWEGTLASLAAATLFAVVYLKATLDLSWTVGLPLGVATNIAAQFGDLAESALKRGAGVKDSGSWLPGHGGWLDRLDTTLFTLPLVYLYVSRWY